MAGQPQRPSDDQELLSLKTELVKTLLGIDRLQPIFDAGRSYRLRHPFTKTEQLQPYRCPQCRLRGVEMSFRFRPEFIAHVRAHV